MEEHFIERRLGAIGRVVRYRLEELTREDRCVDVTSAQNILGDLRSDARDPPRSVLGAFGSDRALTVS